MFLAKLDIHKGSGKSNEPLKEKAMITIFNTEDGESFLRSSLEDLEKRYEVQTSFNYHGDVYFLLTSHR